MLEFFRRYQRSLLLVITIAIIISFSFFGTYSAFKTDPRKDQVAFTTVNGRKVKRSELEEMALFLSSDTEDKRIYGGAWGPNFLNDGVIRKDLLETGMAEILITFWQEELSSVLLNKFAKEKNFKPYIHPHANFLSAENLWKYFTPEMAETFESYQKKEQFDSETLALKVKLYLLEKNFPAPLLKQAVKYQERQYSWLPNDERLDRLDLSLFGHHSLSDWFGREFPYLASEFILNAASIAHAKGYNISQSEAMADLMKNAELSFQQNIKNPNLGVSNPVEYFNEQLRRLGIDRTIAIRIWQNVMLFRRLFQDQGNAILVDTAVLKNLEDHTNEYAEIELYQFPKPFRFDQFDKLQKFEIYLNAIAKREKSENMALDIPSKFQNPELVKKKFPELVQEMFLIEISEVDKKNLTSKIGIKQIWNWEVEDPQWEILKNEFRELGIKTSETKDQRFAILNSLDSQSRIKIDTFARKAYIDTHPEILTEALEDAPSKTIELGIRLRGGSYPIEGLASSEKHLKKLTELFENALKGDESAEEELKLFTADNLHYYRIKVLEKKGSAQILPFADVAEDGTIDNILNPLLENHYKKIRDKNIKEYQNENGEWKSFAEVKNQVAENYFKPILAALKKEYPNADKKNLYQYRFYTYLENERFNKINGLEDQMTQSSLAEQWKIEKHMETALKKDPRYSTIFASGLNEWSEITPLNDGSLIFYRVLNKGIKTDEKALNEQILKAKQLLSKEAQQNLMHELLENIELKQAMSINFLNENAIELEE